MKKMLINRITNLNSSYIREFLLNRGCVVMALMEIILNRNAIC